MTHNWAALSGALFLIAAWLGYPGLTYSLGTSESIEIEVLAEPFIDRDVLVYRWTGDVVRSCPVELRRMIVDSDNVVTNLTSREMGRLPNKQLGRQSYEVSVPVPLLISEGPAVYQVTEIPRCNWMQRLFPIGVEYPPVEFTVTR